MTDAAVVMPGGDDTIVAQVTASGRSAVAVIRLSGARARDIARALGVSGIAGDALEQEAGRTPAREPRRMYRAQLMHPTDGALLDDVLVTWFRGPRSFTGEDVVEFATHGGVIAPMRVIAACIAAGARPAYAGEFTRRAVLNGKLDVLQAEAIADVIDARTSALQQQALGHLDGGLSRRLLALREEIIHLEALLAYDVDFPGEDDGPIERSRITAAAASVQHALSALLSTAPAGAIVRDGALVVLAGAPNVGKSSLFNALLGESRAIVTPIAGTTRDAIEALLDRLPVPLRLVDTAGLRDTSDELERLGIEVSSRYLAQAQVVLACGTTSSEIAQVCEALALHTTAPLVPVLTKVDVRGDRGATPGVHAVSSETGDGLDALLAAIDATLKETITTGSQSELAADRAGAVMITRERHRAGLAAALAEISSFSEAWQEGALPATVAAVHLFAAREALGDLIGTVDVEDVLERVFREFCVGK